MEHLIVITSQVGDEYTDTGRDVEAHILPLMRAQGIRYVQVARHGHFEADGITVLDDSRTPARVFLEGDYKLSDELKRNGTVPQYGGVHRCALKFKAWVIEQWLEEHVRGRARHAIGYNAETGRVARSEYAIGERIAFGFSVEKRAESTAVANTTHSAGRRSIRCSNGVGTGGPALNTYAPSWVSSGKNRRAFTVLSTHCAMTRSSGSESTHARLAMP